MTIISYRLKVPGVRNPPVKRLNIDNFITPVCHVFLIDARTDRHFYTKSLVFGDVGFIRNVVDIRRSSTDNTDLEFVLDLEDTEAEIKERRKEIEKKYPDLDPEEIDPISFKCKECGSYDFNVFVDAFNEVHLNCSECGAANEFITTNNRTLFDDYEKRTNECGDIEV